VNATTCRAARTALVITRSREGFFTNSFTSVPPIIIEKGILSLHSKLLGVMIIFLFECVLANNVPASSV
jgi:hypothetical protein